MESLIRRGALSKDSLRILPASWWESLPAQTAERFADLKTEGPSDTDRALVVQAKADAVRKAAIDLDVGKRVFQERCASCHQLGGQGKVIGPQLDGAIVRTIDRLCEDILWPNRNVDEAFRITNVLLEDGETFSGLILDRNDSSLEIVDQAGKSQRVARGQIEQEKISKLSLMPGNFEELISDAELASLIGFMKSQQPANKP
jgi:putative heme-binding domain-containing protein